MVSIDLSDRSRNVYFDTSIYNRLLDDPEKEWLVQQIRANNLIVIPSAVNLCELLMTSDPSRKADLIRTYDEIRNDFFPLMPFTWLLKESVESVERGLDYWTFNYPIDINLETENICRELMSNKGVKLETYIQGARDFIQDVAKKEKLADEFQYFDYINSENGDRILLDMFDQICGALSLSIQLSEALKLSIVRSPFMPWKYYLEAYAYLFYRRAFPDRNYGKWSNPGDSDLEQCVYLFWAGKFIIEDANFIKFLNRLKELRKYDVEIMNYSDFKNYLINDNMKEGRNGTV
jgi:hypothetical protein